MKSFLYLCCCFYDDNVKKDEDKKEIINKIELTKENSESKAQVAQVQDKEVNLKRFSPKESEIIENDDINSNLIFLQNDTVSEDEQNNSNNTLLSEDTLLSEVTDQELSIISTKDFMRNYLNGLQDDIIKNIFEILANNHYYYISIDDTELIFNYIKREYYEKRLELSPKKILLDLNQESYSKLEIIECLCEKIMCDVINYFKNDFSKTMLNVLEEENNNRENQTNTLKGSNELPGLFMS